MPIIRHYHDSGEADSFLYYVMPFVDGESLRDKLNREKQLSVEESVEITKAVASALDYAHRQNVIHRDIKPENILLHDGQPVVADFGIALAVSAAGGTRITETGLSLGTPHYMSPEQATGDRELDARSDVYSLACVTYEMLTGDPPHTGSTAQAIIAAVVTERPRPVSERRPTVPPNVEVAVHRALEKLPADRLPSAQRYADAIGDPDLALPDPTSRSGGRSRTGPRSRTAPWKRRFVAATVFGGMSFAAAVWGWSRAPATLRTISRQAIALGSMRSSPPSELGWDLALSPDGAAIVFADTVGGVGQLWIKRRDRLEATLLDGTIGGRAPFFSPDGEWIAFFVDGTLRKMPLGGGGAVTIAESARRDGFAGGAWASDGTIAFIDLGNNLRTIREPDNVSRVVLNAVGQIGGSVMAVSALPGGRGWLYTACGSNCTIGGVWVHDAQTGEVQELVDGARHAWYVPGGHLVYVTGEGGVFAVRFSLETLTTTGSTTPLFDGVRVALRIGSGMLRNEALMPEIAVSQSGSVLYVAGTPARISHEVVWVSRNGRSTPVTAGWTVDVALNVGLALSPDGKRLVMNVPASGDPDRDDDIWVKDLDDGPFMRLTSAGSANMRPRWMPDGRSFTFISNRGEGAQVYQRRADGSGDASLTLDLERSINEAFWSHDGEWLVVRLGGNRADPDRDIFAIAPTRDSALIPLSAEAGSQETSPTLSPDGRWLAYVSNESGRNEGYVRPFPNAAAGKWSVSTNEGTGPAWAHSGRELFYRSSEGLIAAAVVTDSGFRVRDRRTLFSTQGRFIRGGVHRVYDISPDDSRFIMIEMKVDEGTASSLVLIENLFDESNANVGR